MRAVVMVIASVTALAILGVVLRAHFGHVKRTGPEMHVPRAGELVLDGELVEPSWHTTAVAHLRKPNGSEGRPYSDVRFLWDDQFIHVGLYASDHDIISAGVSPDGPVWKGDSFHVVFSKDGVEHAVDVGITENGAVITDGVRKSSGAWDYGWQSGARVATDTDGTVDHPGDNDEEWVVEMEIPLAALDLHARAGESLEVRVRRCDIGVRGGAPTADLCAETENLNLVFAR